MTTMMAKTQASESPTPAQVDAGVVQMFETDQEWKDDRLRKPNVLVRILGWLVRVVVWEAMRQHPPIRPHARVCGPSDGWLVLPSDSCFGMTQ